MRLEFFNHQRLRFRVFGNIGLSPIFLFETFFVLFLKLSNSVFQRIFYILFPFNDLCLPFFFCLDFPLMNFHLRIPTLNSRPAHSFDNISQKEKPNVIMTHSLKINLLT